MDPNFAFSNHLSPSSLMSNSITQTPFNSAFTSSLNPYSTSTPFSTNFNQHDFFIGDSNLSKMNQPLLVSDQEKEGDSPPSSPPPTKKSSKPKKTGKSKTTKKPSKSTKSKKLSKSVNSTKKESKTNLKRSSGNPPLIPKPFPENNFPESSLHFKSNNTNASFSNSPQIPFHSSPNLNSPSIPSFQIPLLHFDSEYKPSEQLVNVINQNVNNPSSTNSNQSLSFNEFITFDLHEFDQKSFESNEADEFFGTSQCQICFFNFDDTKLNCGHSMCCNCFKLLEKRECPFCRSKITI